MSKSKYVMIKTISSFEHTYMIPMQEGMSVEDHLDYVTCEEVEEMSQNSLGETILTNSTRVLTQKEALERFDAENDYLSEWNQEQKLKMINSSLINNVLEEDDNV